jgi:hypothetical protein
MVNGPRVERDVQDREEHCFMRCVAVLSGSLQIFRRNMRPSSPEWTLLSCPEDRDAILLQFVDKPIPGYTSHHHSCNRGNFHEKLKFRFVSSSGIVHLLCRSHKCILPFRVLNDC